MVALFDLWLPILVAAVFVFVLSSLFHMVIPLHKGDYAKLPAEDAMLAALREHGLRPGDYAFPLASSMKEMATPEMIEKLNRGPVGFMHVLPNGPMAMGKNLGAWFLYSVLIGVFVAYAASLSMPRAVDGMLAFRFTAAIATLAYATANVPASIWQGQRWTVTAKFAVDGLVYGLATGAAFAWLWPA